MPEAKCYPGTDWQQPAIAGYSIGIHLPEEKLLEGGGFGWAGKAWLVCPVNAEHKKEIAVVVHSSDDPPATIATWTPAVITGVVPEQAPCEDRVGDIQEVPVAEELEITHPEAEYADTWTIMVEPGPSLLENGRMFSVGEGEPFVVENVHIVGLPGSWGFPPVGHH